MNVGAVVDGDPAEPVGVFLGIAPLKLIVQVNKAPGLFKGEQVGDVVIPETVAPVTAVATTPAGN